MKNLIAAARFFALLLFTFQPTMAQGSVDVPQIQIGTFSTTGTTLAGGDGERLLTVPITFTKPFKVKPEILVSITTIDAETKANVRVGVKAEGISRDGFTVAVKTWADSKIHGVQGSWIAVAPTTTKVK